MNTRVASLFILTGLVLSGCTEEGTKKQSVVSARPAEEIPAEPVAETEPAEETEGPEVPMDEEGAPPAVDSEVYWGDGLMSLKAEDKIEEEAPFNRSGEWKEIELHNDLWQAVQLVRQATVDETYAFGKNEVHLQNVNLVKFIEPVDNLDEYTSVKVKEEKPAYGLEITYKARTVGVEEGTVLYYLGLSKIMTSEGQSIVLYDPKGEYEEEPDNIGYGMGSLAFGGNGEWGESEVMSLLEPDTFEQLAWVDIELGGSSTDGGFVEGEWGKYVEDIGPTVRVSLKK